MAQREAPTQADDTRSNIGLQPAGRSARGGVVEMADKKRIGEIEIGDRVAIDTGSVHNRYIVKEVTKITETQITIGGERFNKRTGIRIGDGDSYTLRWQIARNFHNYLISIEEAQQHNKDREQELEAGKLATKIKNASYGELRSLPLETLQRVIELLGLEE